MRCAPVFSLLAACVLMVGCSTGSLFGDKLVAVSAPNAVAEAQAALAAGRTGKALELLEVASRAQPLDKEPWLRMAQIHFDNRQYGEAISHAQEALARDGSDKKANSILAVSGLRVASHALADLTRKNNLQGSVRSEAQELTRLLRTSLGEEALVAGRSSVRKDAAPRKAPVEKATPPREPAQTNPFDVLR